MFRQIKSYEINVHAQESVVFIERVVMTIPIMQVQQQQMMRAIESPIASACCPGDSVEFVR
jgi:hypothetical protein